MDASMAVRTKHCAFCCFALKSSDAPPSASRVRNFKFLVALVVEIEDNMVSFAAALAT